jgi:hypothetical protein
MRQPGRRCGDMRVVRQHLPALAPNGVIYPEGAARQTGIAAGVLWPSSRHRAHKRWNAWVSEAPELPLRSSRSSRGRERDRCGCE